MNSQQYASPPQNYSSRNARYAQSRESASPLRNMQIEYAKALDQIEDLKHEKESLRNALDEALRDKSDQDYREHSLYIERASQNLQESYTHKLYVQSEHRVLALEEEIAQLKKQLDSQASKTSQLQSDLKASQNKIQELNHIEAYNKHLQAEVQYLDQEFQNITKKVEWLDEDKAKTQLTKSVSTKYSQNYNQTLLKYINYLVKVIESLDSRNPIRCRFSELFSKNSSIFKLVGNSDYTSLLLKAFKFIADLMPCIAPNLPLADFSMTQDVSPNRSRNLSASSFNAKGILGDISPIAIPNPVLQARSPTSNRTLKNNGSATPTKSVKSPTSLTERTKQPAQAKRNMSGSGQQLKPNESASFGRRDNQSFSAAVAIQSQRTPKATQESPQVARKNVNTTREYESANPIFRPSEYERQNTAELELIQRDRELLEKERQLIERKRLLMQRARELEEEEEAIRGQQNIVQEKERKSTSDFPLNSSVQKSKRELPQSKLLREDEPQSNKSLKPILKSQNSLAFADANRDESFLNNSSASIKGKSAKDISAVLREKSKHLAQVLTRMGSYETTEASPFINNNISQPEQERTMRSEEPRKVKLQTVQSNHSPAHSLPVYQSHSQPQPQSQSRKEYNNHHYEEEHEEQGEEDQYYSPEDNNNISYRSNNLTPHSHLVDTGRGGPKEMFLQKRVSFDERQVTEGFEDDDGDEEESPQEYMYHGAYPEHEEDTSMRQSRSRSPSKRSIAEPPRGKQFSTFTVAFGRTESIERRSTSPPMRDIAGILDTPSKKRVHHTSQSYNVVTADDVRTVASPDSQKLHYKLAYESAPYNNRSNRVQAFNKNALLAKSHTKSSVGSISSKLSL